MLKGATATMMASVKNGAKTRGKPFQPGNPGRPKGARNKRTLLAEQIMAEDLESVARAVVTAAKGGDTAAARIVLDRLASVRRGRPIRLDLPAGIDAAGLSAAFDAVLIAVADGQITPEEAASVATLLEARRKAAETAEVTERIAALERRTNQ
jgi:hypothetical protein